MAPFTQWLPPRGDQTSDLVLSLVAERPGGVKSAGMALEAALVREGFELLAETGDLIRRKGGPALSAMRLRVSTELMSSIGHGCDVLASLTEDADDLSAFGLSRGSVLLGESRMIAEAPPGTLPAGLITYSIPYADLSARFGRRSSGRGLVALGVLTEFLQVPRETVRSQVRPGLRRRCFDAGVAYAQEHVAKRDIFALTVPGAARRHVLLDARQAVLLGLGMAAIEQDSPFLNDLDDSPESWVAERVRAARPLVSCLTARGLPGVTVYRAQEGKLMIPVGCADPSLVRVEEQPSRLRILTATDLVDTVRLIGAARRVLAAHDEPVWVMVDQELAHRQQSVPVELLEEIAEEMQEGAGQGIASTPSRAPFAAEREGEPGADIGYATWGTAQGVVREAVGLCRSLGIHVAALYPKVLSPLPIQELEDFAASVKHLVVVEPNGTGLYTSLVQSCTRLNPSSLAPMPGCALTPMDIFLREGLGA
jgi:hypothetical protein